MTYRHIGGGKMIADEQVIGIFDMDTATVQNETKKFLRNHERRGNSETLVYELPRSFVVTDDKIYITTLSPKALERRFRQGASDVL